MTLLFMILTNLFVGICIGLTGIGSKKSPLNPSFALGNTHQYSCRQITGYFLLGLITSIICAAAGAGGPILVMPVLSLIEYPAHLTIGIALFNSIFIALPAAPGYLIAAIEKKTDFRILSVLLLVYGIGVLIGSKYTVKINQKSLKKIIAIDSIAIAIIKLIPYFI